MEDEAETNLSGDLDANAGVEADTDDLRDVHPDNRPEVIEPDDDTANTDAATGDADTSEDEEEIEHGGKKYRVPKALAAERMMQSDYTRKTTELADSRKAFETERQAAQEADTATREDHGKLYSLKAQIASFDTIDWQALNAADPVEAQSLWMHREQAKDALRDLEGSLQTKDQERLQGQQQAVAKAMQETGQTLARDIKGWSKDLADDIAKFGVAECGIQPEEFSRMADPRLWKVLHRAMVAEKALTAKTVVRNQEKLTATTPAKVVTSRSAAAITGLDDRLSGSEWTKRREAQIAARNKR